MDTGEELLGVGRALAIVTGVLLVAMSGSVSPAAARVDIQPVAHDVAAASARSRR